MSWALLILLAASNGPDGPILMLPIDGPDTSRSAFEASFAKSLRARLGPDAVVTHTELDVALTAERTKDVLGCDDVSCLTEILGALGGRWALGVKLVEGQPLASVTVILRDLEDATRVFRIERSTRSLMPAQLSPLTNDLADAVVSAAGWRRIEAVEAAPTVSSGGSLAVHTEPAGARVFLDGRSIGVSPLALSGLVDGEYKLRLKSRGFHGVKMPVEVDGSSEVRVELSELRNWEVGAGGGMNIRSAAGGNAVFFDAVLSYSREIWGPVMVGGIAGYSGMQLEPDEQGAGRPVHHGFIAGANIAIGGCLCTSTFASLAAHSGDQEQREEAQLWLEEDEESFNFSFVHARVFSRLVGRTPGYALAEIGVQLGMMNVMQIEMFWAPILFGKKVAFVQDEVQVAGLGRHAFGVRFSLGWSMFYRSPR